MFAFKNFYKDEPKPEYAPKRNKVNNPKAASPPSVDTIQRGTLPLLSVILINFFLNKICINNVLSFLVKEVA
jgi:hypothetical protein